MIKDGITVLDDVLTNDECKQLINFYKRSSEMRDWHGSKPVLFDKNDEFVKHFTDKITNFVCKEFEIDWCGVVLWPKDTYQPPHIDTASINTVFTSITYLNDFFKGGETNIIDTAIIKPKIGRTVYFDGMKYQHGVNTITEGIRFTLPIWYKMAV